MEKINWTEYVRHTDVLTKTQGRGEYPAYNKRKEG